MNNKALYNIEYGLYLLISNHNGIDNACIINTCMQITSNPLTLSIFVNKLNYTNEIIKKSKKFNISILNEDIKFDLFKIFGYQSGKNINKFKIFDEIQNFERSKNGIFFLKNFSNSFLECSVLEIKDVFTHTMFIAKIDNAEILNNKKTLTYNFYQKNIKPLPEKTNKKGYRCKICGYVYEGENIPDDFICPICKHGKIDFEKI